MDAIWDARNPDLIKDLERIDDFIERVNLDEITAVIYHAPCVDGTIAAALFMFALKRGVTFLPMEAGGPIPRMHETSFWKRQDHVIMIDVAPRSVEDLTAFEALVPNLHILDHHVSTTILLTAPALRYTVGLPHMVFSAMSGASIAYTLIATAIKSGAFEPTPPTCMSVDMIKQRFTSEELASMILMIQEREKENTTGGDESRMFSRMLGYILTNTGRSDEDNLLVAWDVVGDYSIARVLHHYHALACRDKADAIISSILEDPAKHAETVIASSDMDPDTQTCGEHVRALLMDVSSLPDEMFAEVSVIGNLAVKKFDMPVIMVRTPLFVPRRAPIEVSASVRSSDDTSSALGIAKAHGGGGHRNAAGFKMMIGC